MVTVQTEIVIKQPIHIVREYTSNPENAPLWYRNIKAVEWITNKPLNIGARIAFIAHFLGKKLSYTYEVIEMRDNRFVMRTHEGPFPMETTYEWEPVGTGSTRMKLINKGKPRGFSLLFAPFLSFMMKKANQKDLCLLKQILEN